MPSMNRRPEQYALRALPYLKAALDVEQPAGLTLTRDDSPVILPFLQELVISFVVDEGDHFQYVQHRHLREGLTEEALRECALSNLRRHLAARTRIVAHGAIFAVLADGNFEATTLLLDEIWREQASQMQVATLVAAAPARDVLAFGRGNMAVVRRELEAVISRTRPAGDHLLSERLLTWRGHWAQDRV